jgi:regulatory protein
MKRQEQPTVERGHELALRRLAFADYSAEEMSDWLKRRGYSSECVQAIVLKLLACNYINDARLCANICGRWEQEGEYGEKMLRYKLLQRGIDREIIDSRLADTRIDEYAKADKAFLSYLKKIKKFDKKSLPKIFRHMASRGFSHSVAAKVVFNNKDSLASIDTDGCLDTYFKRLYN